MNSKITQNAYTDYQEAAVGGDGGHTAGVGVVQDGSEHDHVSTRGDPDAAAEPGEAAVHVRRNSRCGAAGDELDKDGAELDDHAIIV
ncbi:hypothetical protein AYI70_g9654 [Smittium culicis]|uniref:Uncharacterized protein n=1 Tax=Smittium culicis TaxID=133412 RepID=A0A1R1XA79_9FUNG|nr:hypothetical protein AYI70_g9654 [Smittium culicis]